MNLAPGAAGPAAATIGAMTARRMRGIQRRAVRLAHSGGWIVTIAVFGMTGCSTTTSDTAPLASAATATTAVATKEELAVQVRTDLAAPMLGEWVTGALAAASAPGDLVCTTPYSPLDPETFELAGQVGDQVTAEMLLNLDAALGAAAELCRQGDTTAAAAEHADAQATAAAIEARLVEIGVR